MRPDGELRVVESRQRIAEMLTQAMAGNTASIAGMGCDSFDHPNDGGTYSYYDTACSIIASVQETAGGAALGMVTTCATIEATTPVYQNQPYVARHFEIVPTTSGPANVSLYFTDADFATGEDTATGTDYTTWGAGWTRD